MPRSLHAIDPSHVTFYPKVLICALSRVNRNDAFNNNLLLRNLFADWPRERLTQIYSGGSNGDEGFCGSQYQIGPAERRFGALFFKLKKSHADSAVTAFPAEPEGKEPPASTPRPGRLVGRAGQFLLDSGLYELIFRLRLSPQLLKWVDDFAPDVILAQGYNLSFTWLPLLLKERLNKPLAFYCSDDWPTYLYASRNGALALTSPMMRSMVKRSTERLLAATELPFAFNDGMGEEYARRYAKQFVTLMHCDDPGRFDRAVPIRPCPPDVKSIVAIGAFDDSRWPLILDLEEACRRLNDQGVAVQATVFAVRMAEEGYRRIKACRFVEVKDDPGHEQLPSYLKGADLLYLPETFDPAIASGYRYSISTKAHLFMFSQKPILVYGHAECGLVNYAKREGWGCVVDQRGEDALEISLERFLNDKLFCMNLVGRAVEVAMKNHNSLNVREHFLKHINSCICKT